jgi:hypothetical protein
MPGKKEAAFRLLPLLEPVLTLPVIPVLRELSCKTTVSYLLPVMSLSLCSKHNNIVLSVDLVLCSVPLGTVSISPGFNSMVFVFNNF